MIGSSRASLAEVREKVNAQYENPALGPAGDELLQVADLLGREKPLRSALADSGRSSSEREAVLQSLLEGRTGALAQEFAAAVAGQRWSSESDLVDAFEIAGAQCLFEAAERADALDTVENELFRFGRTVASAGDLQLALSSPALPAEVKQSILDDLLAGRANPTTIKLLAFVTSHLRGRRIDQAVDGLIDQAAERRGRVVALVQCARPLADDQRQRLSAALERIYSRPVVLNIELDPRIIGGITVQIDDEVIDGSIAGRLESAKRRITG